MSEPDLTADLGFIKLKNPVIAASGTFGCGLELANFTPPEALGAVIPKGISLDPWPGNPSPRACESAGGLINAIGLENMGAERFFAEALPPLKKRGAVVGVNILGKSAEEYWIVSGMAGGTEADFIELNISCPNLSHKGGLSFGADPEAAFRLIKGAVKAAGGTPVIVKLPPLVTDIALLAETAEKAGASGISLINSVPAMAIDIRTRKPKISNITGGLSGPPVKPLALRQVYLAAKAVSIPVIGLGGIFEADDALEFFLAGAAAVQTGTAILADPRAPLRILEGIRQFLSESGESLDDFKRHRLSGQIGSCSF